MRISWSSARFGLSEASSGPAWWGSMVQKSHGHKTHSSIAFRACQKARPFNTERRIPVFHDTINDVPQADFSLRTTNQTRQGLRMRRFFTIYMSAFVVSIRVLISSIVEAGKPNSPTVRTDLP